MENIGGRENRFTLIMKSFAIHSTNPPSTDMQDSGSKINEKTTGIIMLMANENE